jgi:hypothetical protein
MFSNPDSLHLSLRIDQSDGRWLTIPKQSMQLRRPFSSHGFLLP